MSLAVKRSGRKRRRRLPDPNVERVLHSFFGPHLAKRTVRAYQTDLDRFADFCGISREKAVLKLVTPNGERLVQQWLDSMVGKESYSTRRRRASTLRSLRKLCATLGLCEGTFHVNVEKTMKGMQGPSPDVVSKILKDCGEGAEGLRNRALVVLMSTLGLRRAEAASLRVDDYKREVRRLRVHGKGGKMRALDVPVAVADVLEEWMDFDKSEGAIFHAIGRATPLTGGGVSDIFYRLSDRVGVKVRPDDMRHLAKVAEKEKNSG